MKTKIQKIGMWILMLGFGLVFNTSCDDDDDDTIGPIVIKKSVVDIAASNENFTSLVAALSKADLVNTLKGDGPFTVFAPTNEAFEDLFDILQVSGIEEIPAETLTPILLYHVLGVEASSADLSTGYVQTLSTKSPGENSLSLYIELDNGVKLNKNTMVTTADIMASNGIIHVIDKVLLPPKVVDIASTNSNFSILVSAVVKANLVETLNGEGPFTIFAPTDVAFEALFTSLGVNGIDDIAAEDLVPILTYHVISGNIRAADVSSGTVETLNAGNNIEFNVSGSAVTINGDTQVIATDVQGTNGVIHVIDKVLIP